MAKNTLTIIAHPLRLVQWGSFMQAWLADLSLTLSGAYGLRWDGMAAWLCSM